MAVIPRALRPAALVRAKAISNGLLGPSLFWKVVAGWVFGRKVIRKFVGKQPESLGTWRVQSNGFVNVISAKPPTKKQRKATGLTKKAARSAIIAAAVADARRKNPDAKIVVKTR